MLVTTTPAATNAVSLAAAKAHLRVDHSDDDALITALIQAAEQMAQEYCQRRFVTQTIDWFPSCFPRILWFPVAPVDIATVALAYVADGESDYTAWASSNYLVRSRGSNAPAYLFLREGISLPSVETDHAAPWRVRFNCGDAAAPATVQQAILLMIGDMYRHRETVHAGPISGIPMSTTVENLLRAQVWA